MPKDFTFKPDDFKILLTNQTTEVLPFVPVIPIILCGGNGFIKLRIKSTDDDKFSTINCGIFKLFESHSVWVELGWVLTERFRYQTSRRERLLSLIPPNPGDKPYRTLKNNEFYLPKTCFGL